MGPWLISHGNGWFTVSCAAYVKLQWGRGLLATETISLVNLHTGQIWLQWGRGLLATETSRPFYR